MKTLKEQIEVMTHFLNGGEVEVLYNNEWAKTFNPDFDWQRKNYNYQIYDYPMYFECIASHCDKGMIVEFTGLEKGNLIKEAQNGIHKIWKASGLWEKHTNKEVWKQVEKPKEVVKIEKWLVEFPDNERRIIETSDVEAVCCRKIKLLETYEVQI